jgi:hypothetical protein
MSKTIVAVDNSAFDLCQRAVSAPSAVPDYTVDLVVSEMHSALKELCALDALYTKAGCTPGSLQPKWDRRGRSNRLVLTVMSAEGKKERTYIGADPARQQDAKAKVLRFKARHALRCGASQLHKRQAELVLKASELAAQAHLLRADLNEFLTAIRSDAIELQIEYCHTPDRAALK